MEVELEETEPLDEEGETGFVELGETTLVEMGDTFLDAVGMPSC